MVFFISLLSCQGGINVKKLEHRDLGFQELPKPVQKVLEDPSEFKIKDDGIYKTDDIQNLIVLDINKKYKDSSVSYYPFGPESWVKYRLLIDLNKNKKYKLPRKPSRPYIIYDNRLYIPKEYNIIATLNNIGPIHTIKYDEYILK
jgi:hypothetical protein